MNKYVKIVENDYGDLLSENGITESVAVSTITEYKWDHSFDGLGALMDIYIPDIEHIDPEVTIYEAQYVQIPDEGSGLDGENNISNFYYDISFKEIIDPDGEFEGYYFINESYTAKLIATDFGKKIEYYSTLREEDRTYIDIANSGSDTTPSKAFRPLLYSLDEMHDYKFMLENHSTNKYLIVYQSNFLFFGVPSMVLVFT